MSKMYIVRYSTGAYDDFVINNVFVTGSISIAESYVTRFNDVINRYKNFYKQFEEHRYPELFKDPEYILDEDDYRLSRKHFEYYDRWYELKGFNECFFEEIEVR